MEFSFEDNAYTKLLIKIAGNSKVIKVSFLRIFIPFLVCWLPLAIMTLINGTFWTGKISTSFITSFDTQTKLLISMPLFILAQKLVSSKLRNIVNQFISSGIVTKEDNQKFKKIIYNQLRFLKSKWTNLTLFLICYLQVYLVLSYESTNTSFFTWQLEYSDGEASLNMVGKWATLVSRPFVLFLFYRWLLSILVWGNTLRKISNLKLNLYPEHPDLSGGIGFLGYSFRYFTPVTFAISVAIAGNMADFILIEGMHIVDLKIHALVYFIFISLLFILPMMSFTLKMLEAKETSIYENNDFGNGMYRELHLKIKKGFNEVTSEDIDSSAYSAISDYNALVNNVLQMKFLPFTLKDIIPIWFTTALPFLAVLLLEIPFAEIIKDFLQIVV
jgi:hypothetical protein